jgi:hypothetical protein
MRLASFALLLCLLAAPLATPLECVPDCCRGTDGAAMSACPMSGANSGECQFRGCSPESGSAPMITLHAAVLPRAPAQPALLASGFERLPRALRIFPADRHPLTPPPRG